MDRIAAAEATEDETAEGAERTGLGRVGLQQTLTGTKKRAMRALLAEYSTLLREPPEGFLVRVRDPFDWDVGIFGPPSTPYWGGYFKLRLTFPDEYPFEPPKLKFKSRFWHPNVYHNGTVCMSILHDPDREIASGLPKDEKWNPSLSVRTVLLSLISILGSPNPDSPANPEASKMYRSWSENNDRDYVRVIEDIVKRSQKIALKEGVTIPKSIDEYLIGPPSESARGPSPYDASGDEGDCSSDSCLSSPSLPDVDTEESAIREGSWETVRDGDPRTPSRTLENAGLRTTSRRGSDAPVGSRHAEAVSPTTDGTPTPSDRDRPSGSGGAGGRRKRPPRSIFCAGQSHCKRRKKQ